MREATLQITKDCSAIIDNEISDEKLAVLFSPSNLKVLNSTTISALTSDSKAFILNISDIKYKEPMSGITFQKPTKQIEIVKEKMGVKTNKEVGIKVFDYYFKRECEDDE